MEALRQKWRYDCKVSTVTLHKRDVILVRNDKFVGKIKVKGVIRYTLYVNVDVPVYVIENQ